MGLSAFYGKAAPDEERFKFLDHVYESGETNWDSADIYLDSEDLIGSMIVTCALFLSFLVRTSHRALD